MKYYTVAILTLCILCSSCVGCSDKPKYFRIGEGKLQTYTYSQHVHGFTAFFVLDDKPYSANYESGTLRISNKYDNQGSSPSLEVGEYYYVYRLVTLINWVVVGKDKPTWWDNPQDKYGWIEG